MSYELMIELKIIVYHQVAIKLLREIICCLWSIHLMEQLQCKALLKQTYLVVSWEMVGGKSLSTAS